MLGCEPSAKSQAIEHYNKGVDLNNEGRYDEAIAEYNKAIEIDQNFTNAYINRGYDYLKKKQYDPAITDYTKAIELDPEYAKSYNGRGTAYMYIKRFNSAVLDFNKAIELDPNLTGAYTGRDYSTEILTQASEHNLKGVTLADTGKYSEAFTSFSKAIEVYPYYYSAYTNIGIICIIAEQYNLAITAFDSALNLNPDYAPAYSGRGLACIYTESYEEALTDLDRALQIDLDEANDWNNKGVALEQLGELEEATDAYDKALQLEPDSDGIKSNITSITGVIQAGSTPREIKRCYLRRYPTKYEEAWQGINEVPSGLPDDVQPWGGAGLQIKTLTGEWVNDSPKYGLVLYDGGSYWNFDVVLKLEETDLNTGGLHVQQPNTFTGTMQRTLREIRGPVTTVPEIMSEIGKTSEGPVSGTREGSTVKLNYGGKILRLTFDGDYLHGNTNFYDAGGGPSEVRPSTGSYITWTYSVYLRRS